MQKKHLFTFAVVLSLSVFGSIGPVFGNPFRYAHYTWKQVGGNTIEATLQSAFRRNGYLCIDPTTLSLKACSLGDGAPQVGDVILESIGGTQFGWGDSTLPVGSPVGALLYVVTSIDPTNNWLFGLALDPGSLPAIDTTLSHTYAAPGDYTAFTDSCCRVSSVAGEHINNPTGGHRVETIINVGTTNNSPISALPPIVSCPIGALCTFVVPGADPDGDSLSFRFSTSAEASSFGGFIQPGPPDAPNVASIDPVAGLYTWDTAGATLASNPANNTLYSTQVTIEDSTTKVAVDFLIQLVEQDPNPPVIEPPLGSPPICDTTQVVSVGNTKSFDVEASDPDFANSVTLNVAGLPVGATMTPPLPLVVGNPVSSTLSWTPGAGQVGVHVVNFTASSSAGGFVLCPVTIEVQEVTQGESFTCTQVIGFSQTYGWYRNGFEHVSGITNAQWQLLAHPLAGVEMWSNPSYAGWTNADGNNYPNDGTSPDRIHSNCATNALNPDRVIYAITSTPNLNVIQRTWNDKYTGVWPKNTAADWVPDIKAVIAIIRSTYPGVRQIVLQPVVGGPGHSTCFIGGTPVRASRNHPIIDEAIGMVISQLGQPDVVRGFSPEVRTCRDYSDTMGHLNDPGDRTVAASIGDFYAASSPPPEGDR